VPHAISHPPALEERTLLDELSHRIRNELASVINLVSFKAIWTDNADAKEELSNVVDLLHQHVEVHNILTMPDRDALVDAGDQLRKLGLAVCRCKLDRMNIHLLLSIDTLPLESERCWRLALAVYELMTNAVRHACFDGRAGEIKIKLMRAGSWVNCRVTDNGSGLARIKPGRGLRSSAIWQKAWVAGWVTPSARHRPRSSWTSLWRSASSTPIARSPPAAPEQVVD
jgi:two-component sensor histidine kinase